MVSPGEVDFNFHLKKVQVLEVNLISFEKGRSEKVLKVFYTTLSTALRV